MKNVLKVLPVVIAIVFASCSKESIELYEDTELTAQETELVYLAYGETPKEVFENFEQGKTFGFFIPKGETFEDTKQLFSKYDGTVYTLPYFYSMDGKYARIWKGKEFERGIRYVNNKNN